MTTHLAFHGGVPTIIRPRPHFSWPPLTDSTTKAVLDQLADSLSIYDRSGVIAELEDALAEYHGVRYAVLTSSGTAALHSMYAACGLEAGDEVIIPAYTFFATATPLLHLGVVPVLADCDPHGNLDPAAAAKRITSRTRAIVATHLWGMPADVNSLRTLAENHGLILMEDGSHAHGATVNGQKVGTFGQAAAFSLNGPKPLSAGEGGFILVDDDEIYYRVLLHGQYNKRCKKELPSNHPLYPYATTGMGLKLRIHPLAAAIALEQLACLDDYLAGRQTLAEHLCTQLGELSGITVPRLRPGVRSSWYGLSLQYRSDELDGLPIERFHRALLAEGCLELDRPGSTRPLNQLPLFQDPGRLFPEYDHLFAYSPGDFPHAETVHATTLKLPVWHREEDISLVDSYIAAFRKVTDRYRELVD